MAAPPIQHVGRFWTEGSFKQPKQRIILEEIAPAYTDEKLHRVLLPFLGEEEGGTDQVSKRDMDWLVTNYCKKYNVTYTWREHPDWPETVIVLHDKYRTWLRQYRRYMFDIFCRGQRVFFNLDGKRYETTVGQLHFLHWADKYGVLQYLLDNYEAIAADHRERQAQARKDKKKNLGVKRKRQELTPTPQPAVTIFTRAVEFRWV